MSEFEKISLERKKISQLILGNARTLVIAFMLFFTLLNKKLKKNWIEALAMPLSMVLAMVIVVLINSFLPEIAAIEWRY